MDDCSVSMISNDNTDETENEPDGSALILSNIGNISNTICMNRVNHSSRNSRNSNRQHSGRRAIINYGDLDGLSLPNSPQRPQQLAPNDLRHVLNRRFHNIHANPVNLSVSSNQSNQIDNYLNNMRNRSE